MMMNCFMVDVSVRVCIKIRKNSFLDKKYFLFIWKWTEWCDSYKNFSCFGLGPDQGFFFFFKPNKCKETAYSLRKIQLKVGRLFYHFLSSRIICDSSSICGLKSLSNLRSFHIIWFNLNVLKSYSIRKSISPIYNQL